MLRAGGLGAMALVVATCAAAYAQPVENPSRGQLLYATHCIACHNNQVHWRANKRATDWAGLVAQVRRWQAVQGLGWSDNDIADVARYLNLLYYNYPTPD
ncbi:MAG TPA: cytochrome c [Burkholderiaceae bacterium]|nr:cytochrome c [Burkholderiaceae bacterium]